MAATRLDPLSYGVDGLRGALIDRATIGIGVDAIVLTVVASIFLVLGARAFSKSRCDGRRSSDLPELLQIGPIQPA